MFLPVSSPEVQLHEFLENMHREGANDTNVGHVKVLLAKMRGRTAILSGQAKLERIEGKTAGTFIYQRMNNDDVDGLCVFGPRAFRIGEIAKPTVVLGNFFDDVHDPRIGLMANIDSLNVHLTKENLQPHYVKVPLT